MQKTAYELLISDWSSDVCSSDLELSGGDVVVFDPPRNGAREQAAEIAASDVPAVIAVSCNPTTFARDARTLVDGGYRLAEATHIDPFPWSGHLEFGIGRAHV